MNTQLHKSKKTRVKTLIILLFIAFFGLFRIVSFTTSSSNKLPKNVATTTSHQKSEIVGKVTSMNSKVVGVLITVMDKTGKIHPVFVNSSYLEKINVGDLVDIVMEEGKTTSVKRILENNKQYSTKKI